MQLDALIRLQPDHQPVTHHIARRIAEDQMRHGAKLDDNLRAPHRQAFAGAQEKRHIGPAPIVDLGLQRHKAFGAGGRIAHFLNVTRHRPAGHLARHILPAHRAALGMARRNRVQGLQHFQLFVAHRISGEAGRRLHRHQAEQLQQMILHHVAQGAGLVIITGPFLHPHGFSHRHLHMLNIAAMPQRLEQRIGKTQGHQVLHRLLAEIMVNTENLLFGKNRAHGIVDRIGRGQIMANRLFHHHAGKRPVQPGSPQILADRAKKPRRHRQVMQRDPAGADTGRVM